MNENLRRTLEGIENFGFSQNYGLAEIPNAARMGRPNPVNYSINPALNASTMGTSTVQLTVSVTKTGTGSGNDYNPVFLFGSDAITNANKGYTAVQVNNPVQATATAFTNGKNVITFTYTESVGNAAAYTVSQSTDGEYPFFLNSLSGTKTMKVKSMQISVADAADVAQLTNSIQTFELDEFGKSTTNDLTVPIDLYQQQTNGRIYPAPFDISGRKGLKLNVNETNNMVLNIYMYVDPKIAGCGC